MSSCVSVMEDWTWDWQEQEQVVLETGWTERHPSIVMYSGSRVTTLLTSLVASEHMEENISELFSNIWTKIETIETYNPKLQISDL